MTCLPSDVAIIGAGLAGTALALSLHQEGVSCTVYEYRAPDAAEITSGVVLTPNGLRVLDSLGVFSRIKHRCWKATHRTTKNDRDETTHKVLVTDESLFGYKNHRIWRRLLLDEMKLMLTELDVPVQYNSRYEGIVEEHEDEVIFRINGQEVSTSMLIGADGIYSSVRKYMAPDIKPEYTGVLGLISHIRRDTVKWPYEDYEPAFTMQGKSGAFFTMPEDPEANEIMVAMQLKHPDQSRAEWEALSTDKDKLIGFFRTGYDDWRDTGRQVIDQVCANKEAIYLWPFLRMPVLDRWYSETGRIMIVGDSAHAIPPSSGQGINQALEDVHSLKLILKRSQKLLPALARWQAMRQERIDRVYYWTTSTVNVSRLSETERQKLVAEGAVKSPETNRDAHDMAWLYTMNLEDEIERLCRW